MPLNIINHDITTMKVDAIVNSTNKGLVGYSGVDELIHNIGGPKFEKECDALRFKCMPGEAVYTNAYNMDCRYIIHTVTPEWEDGVKGEAAILRSCYRSSLMLARELGVTDIAFPLMDAGHNGFPVAAALKIASTSIKEFLALYGHMNVYLVLFGEAMESFANHTLEGFDEYLEKNFDIKRKATTIPHSSAKKSFAVLLKRIIKDRKVKVTRLAKDAEVPLGTLNKILNGTTKMPSRRTIFRLFFALEMSLEEAESLLASLGQHFNPNDKYDMLIRFCLEKKMFDKYQLDTYIIGEEREPIFSV